MISPLQVKLPVVPFKVQPVSPDPPERAMLPEAPAGPMFRTEVAPARRLKVVAVVVRLPPLTARLPAVVTSPLLGTTVKLAPPTVRLFVVTSKPLVASTLPARVIWPVPVEMA